MVLNPRGFGAGTIRRATAFDDPWLRETGAEVYAAFGDFRSILPSWLHHPGVLTFVEEDKHHEPRGFILLGFYEPSDMPPVTYVADLLAIAVAPAHQNKGIGTRLLSYAVDLATTAGLRTAVSEMRLTVAHTNVGALKLFARHGFEVLDNHHGAYDGGQRAIRMRRRFRRST